jgi:hypothetical protein
MLVHPVLANRLPAIPFPPMGGRGDRKYGRVMNGGSINVELGSESFPKPSTLGITFHRLWPCDFLFTLFVYVVKD